MHSVHKLTIYTIQILTMYYIHILTIYIYLLYTLYIYLLHSIYYIHILTIYSVHTLTIYTIQILTIIYYNLLYTLTMYLLFTPTRTALLLLLSCQAWWEIRLHSETNDTRSVNGVAKLLVCLSVCLHIYIFFYFIFMFVISQKSCICIHHYHFARIGKVMELSPQEYKHLNQWFPTWGEFGHFRGGGIWILKNSRTLLTVFELLQVTRICISINLHISSFI